MGVSKLCLSLAVGVALLAVAGPAQAEVLRLDYTVSDLGGGVYEYEFVLTLDNADGTWTPGDGFGWLIIGDSPSAPSPLTGWTPDPADLPIGPWTSWTTSSGGHNGPTLGYVLDQWVPAAVGESLSFSGTSSADLAQGQLFFSSIYGTGTSTRPNFTVANRVGFSITCPPSQTIECAGPGGTPLTLNFQVEESNGEAVTVTIEVDGTNEQTTIIPAGTTPPATTVSFIHAYGLGAHTVTATALNTSGDTVSCTTTVTIVDTTPPTITLLGANPMTIECGSGPWMEPGYTASDICAGDLTNSVTIGGDTVNTMSTGTYSVTYTAVDPSGNSTTVTRQVDVVDTTPPVITANILRNLLWPARNGLIPIGMTASATDICDGPVGMTVTVFSDEANGPAPYSPDAIGTAPANLRLRMERAYPGNGRVYLVRVTATDAAGNTALWCKSVIVPVMPVGTWIMNVRMQAAAGEMACVAAGPTGLPAGYLQLLQFSTP